MAAFRELIALGGDKRQLLLRLVQLADSLFQFAGGHLRDIVVLLDFLALIPRQSGEHSELRDAETCIRLQIFLAERLKRLYIGIGLSLLDTDILLDILLKRLVPE